MAHASVLHTRTIERPRSKVATFAAAVALVAIASFAGGCGSKGSAPGSSSGNGSSGNGGAGSGSASSGAACSGPNAKTPANGFICVSQGQACAPTSTLPCCTDECTDNAGMREPQGGWNLACTQNAAHTWSCASAPGSPEGGTSPEGGGVNAADPCGAQGQWKVTTDESFTPCGSCFTIPSNSITVVVPASSAANGGPVTVSSGSACEVMTLDIATCSIQWQNTCKSAMNTLKFSGGKVTYSGLYECSETATSCVSCDPATSNVVYSATTTTDATCPPPVPCYCDSSEFNCHFGAASPSVPACVGNPAFPPGTDCNQACAKITGFGNAPSTWDPDCKNGPKNACCWQVTFSNDGGTSCECEDMAGLCPGQTCAQRVQGLQIGFGVQSNTIVSSCPVGAGGGTATSGNDGGGASGSDGGAGAGSSSGGASAGATSGASGGAASGASGGAAAGASGSPFGSGASASGAMADAGPPSVLCTNGLTTTTQCPSPETCCLGSMFMGFNTTAMCQSPATACGGTSVACSSTSSCGGHGVCCATTGVLGEFTAASCLSSCTGPNRMQVCDPKAVPSECPPGLSCKSGERAVWLLRVSVRRRFACGIS